MQINNLGITWIHSIHSKKGIAAKIAQVANNTKISDIIVLNLEVNLLNKDFYF